MLFLSILLCSHFGYYFNKRLLAYHFRHKARYWSKIAIFYIPPFDAPVREVAVGILPHCLV